MHIRVAVTERSHGAVGRRRIVIQDVEPHAPRYARGMIHPRQSGR